MNILIRLSIVPYTIAIIIMFVSYFPVKWLATGKYRYNYRVEKRNIFEVFMINWFESMKSNV